MFDIFYSGTKPNLFAHEREASDIKHARELSRTRYFWWITYLANLSTWDFLWEPKPWESHQRHAWRSQHQLDSGIYLVPKDWDETQTNYHTSPEITRLPSRKVWQIPHNIDVNSFDFSWHPDPREPDYEYHFPTQWQPAGGPVYPGTAGIKLVDAPQAQAVTKYINWNLPDYIDFDSVDFSWHPNPLDPPCNYQFDTKWHWNRVGGPEYRMQGATDIKYLDDIIANTQSNPEHWHIPEWIDPSSIDRTWVPCPSDPPYIYEFAVEWGWNNIGGPEYRAPGATERKYVDYFVARTQPDPTNFTILARIDQQGDVLRWRPNPTEQPYIYVFGNQWYPAEIMPTVEYHVAGATERKYIEHPRATLVERHNNHWNTLVDCEWDYSWVPDPGDPPYIYVFGNQWYPATVMPTVEYTVEGATERKYMDHPRAQLPNTHEHWYLSCKEHAFSFDISWCPDPGDSPYIYVFGNQWHSAEVMSTIEYRVPGAVEVKYMDYPRATILPNQEQWVTPDEIDQSNVDYSWIPDPGSPPYIYHFGTDYQASVGLTYHVPDATELKFAGDIPRIEKAKSAVTIQDIFYLDYSNAMSQQRFTQLQERYPHIQKVRYVNSVMDTVKRCLTKTKQNRFWIISSENDYSDFDFAWHAEPWQSGMTHVFGTQWNKWSNTLLINRWEFERCSKWAKSIEDFPNLNFVKDQQVTAPADASDIYVIDFGNRESRQVIDKLSAQYRVVKTARYFDNYLDTLKRIVVETTQEHIWVVSTVCNYDKFDFSWQPEAWQRTMLHVFPSDGEKFGDTFYVHVPSFVEQMNQLELLDWFETVNYCADQLVTRYPLPIIVHEYDTHVEAVKSSNWDGPLAIFATHNMPASVPCVPLWREKIKTIVPLSPGASSIIVPKSAVPYIKTQLYDYPYINKKQKHLRNDKPLDIVFIDNGEPDADHHYRELVKSAGNARIHRSSGVNGRVAAYRAAAELSTTPWFFAVFAKLEVNPSFKWDWQPDRMQEPKHYIFHAYNPVNELVYGHQAVIAYNKKLVLENTAPGLDFTLDQAHEVVPILSGQANYHNSDWMCWRTAFRECIKLRASLPNVENDWRLSQWLQVDRTPDQWSMKGAEDAVEYYEAVGGDFTELKKSYDWEWLASYALLKRNLTPNQ
jgi:hypothetical protein